MGSPLMARYARLLGTRLDDSTRTGKRMLAVDGPIARTLWPCGWRAGCTGWFLKAARRSLAAAYADPDVSDDALWEAIDTTMRHRDQELLKTLDSRAADQRGAAFGRC